MATGRTEAPPHHPCVSVVIPVYGRPEAAVAAVCSVLSQTFTDFEVIVVDDGSPQPAAAYFGHVKDPRLLFVRHDSNQGAAAARNTGVRTARAKVVAFLDSDDEWFPGMLASHVDTLATAPWAAGCTTGYRLEYPDGRVEERHPTPGAALVERAVLGCDLSPGSTLAIRREVWLDLGGLDERLARLEDWDFLLRLAEGHRIEIVPRSMARVRVNAGGPGPDVVRGATDRILERHLCRLGQSARLSRRLRSTAHFEIGLAALRHGYSSLGLREVALSIACDPLKRSWLLAQSVRRRLVSTAGGEGCSPFPRKGLGDGRPFEEEDSRHHQTQDSGDHRGVHDGSQP